MSPSRRRVAALHHNDEHPCAKSLRRYLLQTLTMEAMVLGPQALQSAAMNPVLSADFSPVPVALQRRKPELQGLKTAVAVLRGSPLVKLPHELHEEKLTSTMPHALKISWGRLSSSGGAPGGANSSCSARVGAL